MRVSKKNAQTVLKKYVALKHKKEEIEAEMKEIMDQVFKLDNPPAEVETDFGVLKKTERTNRDVVSGAPIHACLKQMKYTEEEIAKLYKFQTGKLKDEVGKKKFQQWIEEGHIVEWKSQFYKLTKTPKNQEQL